MTDILVKPATLRSTASQIREHSRHVQQALDAVDQIIHELEPVRFEGHRASALRLHYRRRRSAIFRAPALVKEFAAHLEEAAARFEAADRAMGNHSGGGSGIPFTPDLPHGGGFVPPVIIPEIPLTPVDMPSVPPEQLKKIQDAISSLDVVHNDRYRPGRNNATYCNIFAMDFCKKMGIPLPEYLDWNKDGKIDDYLDANEAVNWLRGSYNKGGVQTGPQQGWSSVDANQAATLASQGYVVVAGWQNPKASDPGHMAVVRPESTPGNIRIAQAGGHNFENGALKDGFGNRQVEFFVYKKPDAQQG